MEETNTLELTLALLPIRSFGFVRVLLNFYEIWKTITGKMDVHEPEIM